MSDLPALAASNFIVTPCSNWQVAWSAYTADFHPSDVWTPEDWDKPLALKEIRTVHQFACQKAVGKGRIIAIPNGDQLTRETGNALLKLLEEPPSDVTLVLFGETDRMLATIRSRVCILQIAGDRLSDKRLMQFYREINPAQNPALARRFLYYAPLLHNTIQTDIVFDAFQS